MFELLDSLRSENLKSVYIQMHFVKKLEIPDKTFKSG